MCGVEGRSFCFRRTAPSITHTYVCIARNFMTALLERLRYFNSCMILRSSRL